MDIQQMMNAIAEEETFRVNDVVDVDNVEDRPQAHNDIGVVAIEDDAAEFPNAILRPPLPPLLPPAAVVSIAARRNKVEFIPPPHITPTRYTMLRKVLLNPVAEWRQLPEEYRNDKLFILQFLQESNRLHLPLPCKDDFERKFPRQLRSDRAIVYALSQRYDFATIYETRLLHIPEQYTDDTELMISFCKTISRSLQDCSYRLQNDVDVVTAAIDNDGMELQYASPAMQKNETILRRACRNNIRALNFCSSELLRQKLLNDIDFVTAMFQTAGDSVALVVMNDTSDSELPTIDDPNRQMEYAKKVFRRLTEPMRSNRALLLVAMEHNILSYTDLVNKYGNKYMNDIELLLETISRRASAYLELCEIPIMEHWYKSTIHQEPSVPGICGSNGGCGGGRVSGKNNDNITTTVNSVHDDCHRIAFATITSPTSDATIIANVLENAPTFLLSSEYNNNMLVHETIVDRAALKFVQMYIKETFPHLCSNVTIMTRAIQRDCNLFVPCTEKDDPMILTTAMNADTAYPLLRTKPMEYVTDHVDTVLLHVIRVSKSADLLSGVIPDHVWDNNMVLQKAWIGRKYSLLPCTIRVLEEYNTTTNDDGKNDKIRELALFIAQYNVQEFFHVPMVLRTNVPFMKLALQRSNGRVLKYGCPDTIRTNMDCIVDSIAYFQYDRCEPRLTAFTDIDTTTVTPQQVHDYIQNQLHDHDTFVNPFLCTVVSDQDETNNQGGSTTNPLCILNVGVETSTALLQRIASFVGVPIGQSYKKYLKAYQNVYHFINPARPYSDSTTTPAPMAQVADANVLQQLPLPPPPPVQHIEQRLRLAAIMPGMNDLELDNMMAEMDDDEVLHMMLEQDEFAMMEAENEIAMMEADDDELANDNDEIDPVVPNPPPPLAIGNAADAALEQQQQPPPLELPVLPRNEMEQFLLENMPPDVARRPGAIAEPRLIDPLLRLALFRNHDEHPLMPLRNLGAIEEHRRLYRAIQRRRARNNNNDDPNIPILEEFRMMRMLRRLRRPLP